MTKKGFTLIELLVVIAIIGILSSIAIVYLSDARNKANDAKVSSNVTTASTQLELDRVNDTLTDGTGPFVQGPGVGTDIDLILAKVNAGTPVCTGYAVVADVGSVVATNVAFYSPLCSAPTTYFCADSSGFRGAITGFVPADVDGACQ